VKIKSILILAGLIILLTGVVVYFLAPRAKTDGRPQVWDIAEETIQRIALELPREQKAVSFFKDKEEKWRFEDKTKTPVDIKRWGGITTLVSGPKSKRKIAEKAEDFREYELNDPLMVVTLYLGNRLEPLEILFGGHTPQGDHYYVKLKTSPTVYLLPSEYCQVLRRLVQEPPYPERRPILNMSEGKT
jgi:hypothetical protein